MSHPASLPRRYRLPAVLAILALAAAQAPAPARAAGGGLVVIAQTRYVVEPAVHRVHVTIDAIATSHEPDTSQGRTYYSGLNFAVQPGASNVTATADGAAIGASVTRREDDFSVISVTFGRGVFYLQSYAYTVSFDLVDAGGRGTRDLRIGRNLAAFPVWAFGSQDEPGGSVSVDLPAGFTPDVQGAAMTRHALPEGGTRLSARPENPLQFFAYVTADQPGAFVNTSMQLDVNGVSTELLVRRWDDDPSWGKRVTNLMRRGLPVLQRLIGFDYPGRQPRRLTVEEAATSRLGEYAGIYDPESSVIRIRYDADAVVTLHEAAHIWFNGSLFGDRWIGEAWAEFYGARAAAVLGAHGATPTLSDQLLNARIPLNDWGTLGVESLDVEDFAYAATYEVARNIAGRTNTAGLRLVWEAAASGQESYLPLHHPAPAGTGQSYDAASWQRLLDLLEERTDTSYADLWQRWIVDDKQLSLIARRQSARHRYEQVAKDAGDWELPASIRHQMGLWKFDDAVRALNQASTVLDERDTIAAAARRLRLRVPATLQGAFEGSGGLAAAEDEAQAEQATLGYLEDASAHLDAGSGLLVTIGMLGTDPRAQLASARSHFQDGDLYAADREAAGLVQAVRGAADAGRVRVAVAGGGLLMLDGAWLWLARPRRRAGAAIPA
jgi:hypothetical protein